MFLGNAAVAVGQTQLQINAEAAAPLRAAESEQKDVIAALEAKAKGKSKALDILRSAQAAWQTYRDAQLRAMWPFPKRDRYGSVMPMCVAQIETAMTRARTRELRAMLDRTEGESCNSEWPQ
jgi:uncharacterized protein YecT (DUF1311 family)